MTELKKVAEYFENSASAYDLLHTQSDTAFGYIEKKRRQCVFSLIKPDGIKPNGKILDVGCGTGYYLEVFSNLDCTGMDISKNMIKQCQNKGIERLLLGDMGHISFKQNTFDLVLCIGVFQVLEEPQRALMEMNRVLKPGGEVILTSLNWSTPRSVLWGISKIVRWEKAFWDRYTIFNLRNMFHEAGFEVEELVGFNFLPYKSDYKKRNEKVLNIIGDFERKIRRTPLKYFANEFAIKLKNRLKT
jgi:ubiquinone/menaquinone biosynthesis C-methylase UbiE